MHRLHNEYNNNERAKIVCDLKIPFFNDDNRCIKIQVFKGILSNRVGGFCPKTYFNQKYNPLMTP